MSALVRCESDRLHIFFDGRFGNFVYTSIVAEVNHFNSFGLQDPAHDIDGSVMPIEEGGRRNDAKTLFGVIHKTV